MQFRVDPTLLEDVHAALDSQHSAVKIFSYLGGFNRGTTFVATGTVKWFNETKGYGFVPPDSGSKDVFMHISAVERSGLLGLAEGQKITYEVEADWRSGKDSAVNLKTI